MKKRFAGFVVTAILLAACNKHENNPVVSPGLSIVGNWNVDSVTTYFYDSAGLRGSEINYPSPFVPDIYRYSFRFYADNTWVDSLSSSQQGYLLLASNGTYSITSDSSFILVYPDATPGRQNESCTIISLTTALFIFSKQLATVFSGTDSGYIKYVFKLTK
jgi:hypothetical protein